MNPRTQSVRRRKVDIPASSQSSQGEPGARAPSEAPPSSAPVRDEEESDARIFATMVGESIRYARQQLGWTQAVLAEQAKLSPNYVARLERGELGPSLFVAHRLCTALRMPIDSLVTPHAASSPFVRTGRRAAVR